MLVVIVVLIATFIPAGRVKDRDYQGMKCFNNLRNIGLAYRIWAADNLDLFPFHISTNNGGSRELRDDIVAQFRTLSNELSTPKIILCPGLNPRVSEATNWTSLSRTNIGYFIGLSASETNETSILGGDIEFTVNGDPTKPGINDIRRDAQFAYRKDIHSGWGNLLRADDSVSRLKANDSPKYLQASGSVTNLFLLP